MRYFNICLFSLLLCSCTPTPDAKKLGLSPAQAKEFEKNIAEGNLSLTIGIVMLVLSVVVIAFGIWYQYFRKKAKS